MSYRPGIFRRRRGAAGILRSVISAIVTPTTSPLTTGDTLGDTVGWTTFIDASNYTSSDPADIGQTPTVTVNYLGDAPDSTTELLNGELNYFTITVTYTVSGNSRTFTTLPRVVKTAPAVNVTPPTISGNTSLNSVLTANPLGSWTGAIGGSFSYQWLRNGTPIPGQTSTTYSISVADSASGLQFRESYTNSGGVVSAVSNTITVQTFVAPSISGVPTVSGTTEVGQTLTAVAASTTGNPVPTRTWQWYRSGSLITGATSSSYLLSALDVGENLSVQQKETSVLGEATAQSAETGVIVNTTAAINSITADTAGLIIDYTGTLTITADTAGLIFEVS